MSSNPCPSGLVLDAVAFYRQGSPLPPGKRTNTSIPSCLRPSDYPILYQGAEQAGESPSDLFTYPEFSHCSSQILLPAAATLGPEDRAAHLHVDLVEGAHDSLDPVLVHLREELLDGLLGLRGCWVAPMDVLEREVLAEAGWGACRRRNLTSGSLISI